jgi:hypothetical protein
MADNKPVPPPTMTFGPPETMGVGTSVDGKLVLIRMSAPMTGATPLHEIGIVLEPGQVLMLIERLQESLKPADFPTSEEPTLQ